MPRDNTIVIPDGVYTKCEERISHTTFETVDEYVVFILDAVLTDDTECESQPNGQSGVDEDHLEALGYLEK